MILGFTNAQRSLRITLAGFAASPPNGTSVAVTGSLVPFITGGFQPYAYDWTDSMANVFVQTSTTPTCSLRSTGTDVEHNGQVTLILTEANGVVTTTSVNVVITQGAP